MRSAVIDTRSGDEWLYFGARSPPRDTAALVHYLASLHRCLRLNGQRAIAPGYSHRWGPREPYQTALG